MAASGAALPSVVIFRLRDMRPERVNVYLREVVTKYHDVLKQGVILCERGTDSFAESSHRTKQVGIDGQIDLAVAIVLTRTDQDDA